MKQNDRLRKLNQVAIGQMKILLQKKTGNMLSGKNEKEDKITKQGITNTPYILR